MSTPLYLSIENFGDPQYLQDHHNREGESLIYLTLAKGATQESIKQEIISEIEGDDSIPEDGVPDEQDMIFAIADILITIYGVADSLDVQILITWES
jgi:hypothetical protein